MTDSQIQQICDGLSVCVSCYKKIHAYLNNSSRCHVCSHPIPQTIDFSDLRWVGDEQVTCCGDDSCEVQIRNSDKMDDIFSGWNAAHTNETCNRRESDDN